MISIGKISPEPGAVRARSAAFIAARRFPASGYGIAPGTWEDEGGRTAPSAMRSSRD
jgi:hypothetical protein